MRSLLPPASDERARTYSAAASARISPFPVGERWAEVYTLAVLPGSRGSGTGSALLDAADARLAALGIHDVAVAAMVENEAALAFYRRRGFVPREVVLWRFRGDGRTVYPRDDAAGHSGPTTPREESP